jgi:hypothetical protein
LAAEECGFDSRQVRESFPSLPLDWLRGTGRSFSEAERPEPETYHLPLSGAEIKNMWVCIFILLYIFTSWW